MVKILAMSCGRHGQVAWPLIQPVKGNRITASGQGTNAQRQVLTGLVVGQSDQPAFSACA